MQRITRSPEGAGVKAGLSAAMLERVIATRTAELQAANEALKKSEERYHKMIEEVEDYAILLLDKNGIVQNWNRGAEKIKGYAEQEIVGRHFRQFYLPEDQECQLPERLLQEAAASGKAAYEGWRVRKDSTVFWGSIVLTALHRADGEIIGFSKVTRDLTDRKNAEEKLREYAQKLENQNKELEQFAYVAAHDMKQPLRQARLYVTRALEGAGAGLQGQHKNSLERAVVSMEKMRVLIDDLLAYSRAAFPPEPFEAVNLNDVLSETIASHLATIRETSASIIHGPLPVVQAIPYQMRQLFDNITGNALKYRHPDRDPQLHISCERVAKLPDGAGTAPQVVKEYHAIRFRDNGIGFDPSDAEHIFGVFQRLPASEAYPGSGIGLAICRKIVQAHKGYIMAEGQPGEGACISIYLPVENG